ncbi:MAG: glutathione S-transferase family protein [Alphaproteobacteria bacterium]|nr:glutathione S-transferase family protein [Alphaproteobacteria bacterium]
MAELKICGVAPSTFTRTARLVAHEKGLAYDLLPPGTEGAPRHPFGRMPVAARGDTVVCETPAIVRWFDAIGSGPSLVPADPLAAVRMEQWISICCDYVYDTIVRGVLLPRFGLRQRPEADVQADLKKVPDLWRPLEATLKSSRYLAGDAVSLADFFLVPIMFYVPEVPDLMAIAKDGWTEIPRWAREMGQRDSVKATDPMPVLKQMMTRAAQ